MHLPLMGLRCWTGWTHFALAKYLLGFSVSSALDDFSFGKMHLPLTGLRCWIGWTHFVLAKCLLFY